MSLPAGSAATGIIEQQSFVSEAFHKLSQPLTALHCSLELSLARDVTPDEYRGSIEAALQNAERLRQSLFLLRELTDADDPGDMSAAIALRELLLELREDLLPIFESAGRRFDLTCLPVQVRGNRAKLTRAFFYLLEYLQRSFHSGVNISVHQKGKDQVEVRILLCGTKPSSPRIADLADLMSAGAADIARRTFRAVGGELKFAKSRSRCVWIARLPLAT